MVGHDAEIIEMRNKVENLWKEEDSKRLRRTKATEAGSGGFSIFSDNVGKVSSSLPGVLIFML